MASPTPIYNVYGNSELFTGSSIDISEVFNPAGNTSMPLGRNENDSNKGLAYDVGPKGHTGHALTFGRTRGGKGVSTIIPALLTYKGSMVVIDPKGENAWITAERRRKIGNRVVILDPWDEVNKRYGSKVSVTEKLTRFNPLSALDPNDLDFADDVSAIAEAFILPTGNDPHWSESARELTGGLIAAEVQNNPGAASMSEVRKLLRAPLPVLKTAVEIIIRKFPESVAAGKLAAVVETDAEGQPTSSREMSSIRSSARTQTAFLDSARLQESMQTDETPFNLADLATDNVTLYLVLPVDRLRSHGRWLRMILTLAIRAIAKQATPPALPVVFMLDELGTISPGSSLSMIEQSYGLMAGLGIRIWAFLQDLPQLKRDYPDGWETFISNSSVIQLLNVGDGTTSAYFSEYLGNMTVNAKTGSQSLQKKQYPENQSFGSLVIERFAGEIFGQGMVGDINTATERAKAIHFAGGEYKLEPNGSRTYAKTGLHITGMMWSLYESVIRGLRSDGFSEEGYTKWDDDEQLQSRPVLFPWEVRTIDPAQCLIIFPGFHNARLKRFRYYSDPVFSKWARHDPNKPAPPPFPPPRPSLGTIPPRPATPEEIAMWGPRFNTNTGKQIW